MEPIKWQGDRLILLDQRRLPNVVEYLSCETSGEVFDAIRNMIVRGAPAIGVTAAYGMVLASIEAEGKSLERQKSHLLSQAEMLRGARPTAVNLAWSIDKMIHVVKTVHTTTLKEELEAVAVSIHDKDLDGNHKMGILGAELIGRNSGVLTHCNAGALATTGYGTALGVIRSGYKNGSIRKVFATETRPWFQGSRLTATELGEDGIGVTLITDGAAGFVFKSGEIDWVVVGADRIAMNGDVANKIGTYSLAILAKYHKVRFMVVAPTSTIDREASDGSQIPIEYRPEEEITKFDENWLTRPETEALNPVFDITPASLVDVLVTEKGAFLKPEEEKMRSLI